MSLYSIRLYAVVRSVNLLHCGAVIVLLVLTAEEVMHVFTFKLVSETQQPCSMGVGTMDKTYKVRCNPSSIITMKSGLFYHVLINDMAN